MQAYYFDKPGTGLDSLLLGERPDPSAASWRDRRTTPLRLVRTQPHLWRTLQRAAAAFVPLC